MSHVIEATKEAALRELIAQRAYEIWENQGRPQGCDLIHWHEAEQEIMGAAKQTSDTSEAPEVPRGSPAKPEQEPPAQHQGELHETEGSEAAIESPDTVVRVSRSFFALVVPAK